MKETTRALKRKANMDKWKQIIQDRQASGMSIADFCKSRGFSDKTYYRYQKLIRDEFIAQNQQLALELLDGSAPDHSERDLLPEICAPAAPAAPGPQEQQRFGSVPVQAVFDSSLQPVQPQTLQKDEILLPSHNTDSCSSNTESAALSITTRDFVLSIHNNARIDLVQSVLEVLMC